MRANKPLGRVVADVGGTNARFATVYSDGSLRDQQTLACQDADSFAHLLQTYIDTVSGVEDVTVAIACPVLDDQVYMTNRDWSFSIEKVRTDLQLNSLTLLNDFTALALGIPHLSDSDIFQIGEGKGADNAPIGVLGPGTGLGVSGLIPNNGSWIALQGEGGHVSVPPANKREAAVLMQLWEDYTHVSAERVVSGMGLENLHRALLTIDQQEMLTLSAEEISLRALAGSDAYCKEALDMFCALLGSVAGNLALTLGASGGIYIGGGIVPKLLDYFSASEFRERFEAKGRYVNYLKAIPTCVILADKVALLGAKQSFPD